MLNTFQSLSCAVLVINSKAIAATKSDRAIPFPLHVMEDTMNEEQLSLINELIQGKELAEQLCNHLVSSSSPSSHETNESLIEKILSTYEKALTMLNWESNVGEIKTTNGNMMNSHCSSTNGSPRSEVMDEEFGHKPAFKKRKTMPKKTEQVKICSKTGLEGSLDDGYSWRKYGQKDILGAKFPRGYYRCTHRNVQGCLATKQVQRSDEDPTIIEVTYRGRHTCIQAKHLNKAFPSKIKMGLGENQLHKDQNNQPKQEKMEQPPEGIFTFESKLEVKSEDLDTNTKEEIFPWYCFLSPSMGSENDENNILSDTMMENHFMETFSPAFISPETSESNLFCMSLGSTGLAQNVQTSESGITEIVSAPTSVTNSPILDLDILLGKVDFDSDFPFNTPEYFSS